ncbi:MULTISPECIES: bifunctional ADP-dependent NAD(P)H-hydrate dehydratase/NAD(P)H-hydrate epimerase [Bifidobacterium]|jgi:NAD(P)H-hydrate repair Nnr-like enzyme with NAD(P)H-hydrate dehydratase domain/NAD(P)H-hydrate repair Nnr-like enzyme with NAD(P)H-hydrate epimerase domain|uniref:ADP-dependent (S)-NAD(P)H-hydrate dehydratase n=1 Tax=Bifidobacterium tibiigranuli TaxID=2172043 RepID=A0A5N6SA96_9BIFI|nr:bifunctional ADP-dependent NAD(P)H-hydrate dehydratase/NAD(P)H-hydrate epimerase [Bifidobacterium tibiigranuli]KAE8130061.1 bifunctional ADP-dependent NAD(P)H-hydrate dehydratase/NAD(P)H-hydrate epimerase [Bifidobacterium tibiigranuli]KAE8130581.1 bifunctional ADP-dependent NAD(P)H-hydrate dehydratase/NAD(P)H-hydrate epimerase [Bifidobacterium tibiigranuli]MCH3974558.1 bifunctional ADP-dependent NAD(P)H-hydrate dehydratase/NAD(P)H-hydrate epimerase [Bifidobacterium tibiigranuli]MCH4189476.1 
MERNTEDSERLTTLLHTAYAVPTIRAMERPLLEQDVPLMRMAAGAAATMALQLLADADLDIAQAQVVLLAGAGDNGGDGLYAAAELARDGAAVTAIAVGRSLHEEAFAAFVQAGGKVLVLDPQSDIPGCASGFSAGEAGERLHTAIMLASQADLLLDAMTGIGIKGALRGIPSTLAKSLGLDGEPPASPAIHDPQTAYDRDTPLVLAIDTPSGIGVDDGSLPGPYIPADATAMFGALKPCAMLPPAAYACGTVTLVDFDFDIDEQQPAIEAIDDELARQAIRLPHLNDAKYSRGVVGLITGSTRFPGAAVLGTAAAARTNAGMIRYLGPQRAQDMVLNAVPEAVIGKGRVQSWVVGSGVPSADADETGIDAQRSTIAALLAHYSTGDALNDDDAEPGSPASGDAGDIGNVIDAADDIDAAAAAPQDGPSAIEAYDMPAICVDAGALDLLPAHVPPQVVITPHAGELADLLADFGEDIDRAQVQAEPWHWAQRAHEVTGATVLLKGAVTIVVGDDGDGGTHTLVSGSAPAWLATAGAGDVLAGIMGALLAQQDGLLQQDAALSVEVAASAAYLHGMAAGIAADSDQQGWQPPQVFGAPQAAAEDSIGHPIVASDVVRTIGEAIEDLLS